MNFETLELDLQCFSLVLEFFKKDFKKASLWFEAPNHGLGNITPNKMIEFGRGKKLLEFIKNAKWENNW